MGKVFEAPASECSFYEPADFVGTHPLRSSVFRLLKGRLRITFGRTYDGNTLVHVSLGDGRAFNGCLSVDRSQLAQLWDWIANELAQPIMRFEHGPDSGSN